MSEDRLTRLKDKARSLPQQPGVYIMSDKKGKVIYVGKAKRLKNRVSSYFQDSSSHSRKTRRLVAHIEDFDTIIAKTEFEALVLECSLIKHHMPRYNILLKDGKGYPFIKLPTEPYANLSVVYNPPVKDTTARYFGPYAGYGQSWKVIEAIRQTLRLPTCSRVFPRDIGKGRPCLQYHMGRCVGVCRGEVDEETYNELLRRATLMMEGKTSGLLKDLEAEMLQSAEAMHFEAAAAIRDEMRAMSLLERKQIVVGFGMADTDVIGCAIGQTRAGIAVLHYMNGQLLGRDVQLSDDPDEEPGVLLSDYVSLYYMARGRIPRQVLVSHMPEDAALLTAAFAEKGMKTEFIVPQRGDKRSLIQMAQKNAMEEIERVTTNEERVRKLLTDLQKLLSLPELPARIEAVDMSNTGDSERVGVIVCYKNARPLKKDYRHFIIKDQSIRDDYHAMQEVLTRRFTRLVNGDSGFDSCPQLLLVDGGGTHADMARGVLRGMGLEIPVFGMVKDDRHRTRALMSPENEEVSLQTLPALFAFIGQIQEETHKSAFGFHQKRRSSFGSELDGIAGVGPARREALLKAFKSVRRIKNATAEELAAVVPKNTAEAVYRYFHPEAATRKEPT